MTEDRALRLATLGVVAITSLAVAGILQQENRNRVTLLETRLTLVQIHGDLLRAEIRDAAVAR